MVSWCSRLSHVSHTHGVLSSSLSETILFLSSLFDSNFIISFFIILWFEDKSASAKLLISFFIHNVKEGQFQLTHWWNNINQDCEMQANSLSFSVFTHKHKSNDLFLLNLSSVLFHFHE